MQPDDWLSPNILILEVICHQVTMPLAGYLLKRSSFNLFIGECMDSEQRIL